MKSHLLLVFISIFLGACQVQEEIASVNSSATTNEVSNEFVVTTSMNGWKKKNDVIQITLSSLKKIHKIGSSIPYIEALIGSNIRKFNYASGTGTNSISFNYTVVSADLDVNGIDFAGIVSLNGSILQLEDDGGNKISAPTNLNFKPTEILVDGTSPLLQNIIYPEAKSYSTNDSLSLSLVFSENMKLKQDVSFIVSLDSGPKTLNYFSGNGTKTLTFKAALNSSDSDTDGTIEVNELNFITQLTDQAGNPFVQLLIDSAIDQAWVNLVKPKITEVKINSVSPPAGATYTLGQNIDINLKFDYNVVLSGTPRLTLQFNSGAVKANFLSLAPANQINFRYTVKLGDLDSDGILIPNSIELNGATIKSAANTLIHADTLIPTINTSMVKVSAPEPLKVIYVNSPFGQLYKLGDHLDFTLFFNRPISINTTTPPKISLIIGNVTRDAAFDSIAGPQSVVFRYTLQNTDLDLDGITVKDTIVNPSSITDAYGGVSLSTFSPPYTRGITVDAQVPTILTLSVPSSGTYKADDKLQIVANMSEPVTVTGVPKIKLTIGTTDVDAIYTSGSGTSTLVFSYPIITGLLDTDGIVVDTTLDLVGGNLKDQNHNTITTNLVIAPSPTTGVLVDSVAPSTTGTATIGSTLPKNFKKGEPIDFNITYDESVQVSGTPCIKLSLNSSSTSKCAKYISGESTSTVLKFRYIVEDGDFDGDGISIPSSVIFLGVNQSIKDSAGNNASQNFSPPTLTDAKVDAKAPTITGLVLPPGDHYGLNSTLVFKFNLSETVTVTGTPKINLLIGGTKYEIPYSSGESTSTQLGFKLNLTSTGISATNLQLVPEISLESGSTIVDSNSNPLVTTFTAPSLNGILVNTVRPVITNVSCSNIGRYKAGDVLTFAAKWNKDIVVLDPQDINLKIQIGSAIKSATYIPALSSSNVTVHQYTVVNGDLDLDGVKTKEVVASPTIKDIYNNSATTTFIETVFPDLKVDAVIPSISVIVGVARSYKAGDIINFSFVFSEPMKFTGSPYVEIFVGSSIKLATLTTGSGNSILNFSYTVDSGINDSDGLEILGPIQLGPGSSLTDLAGNPLSILTSSLPTPIPVTHPITGLIVSSQSFLSVVIDNTPPTITGSVTSTNSAGTNYNNYFFPGNVIEFSVTFSETMIVEGLPRLKLDIGGVIQYANYYESTSTFTEKKFRYMISTSNTLLDLNGISLDSAIDLNSGSITDLAGNPLSSLAINYTEVDYVYFNNMVSRYHVKSGSYMGSTPNISTLNDVTGNGNDLTQTVSGNQPSFSTSGFGTKSTGRLTFTTNSFLETTTDFTITHAFFALKTPTPTGTQAFGLISNNVSGDSITLSSTSTARELFFLPNAQAKLNDGLFNNSPTASLSSSNLWLNNTNYVLIVKFSSDFFLLTGTMVGATSDAGLNYSFKGDIAEIIFTYGALSDTQINLIRNQLNDIHGIY